MSVASTAVGQVPRKSRVSKARIREAIAGYLFASPWLLGLLFGLGGLVGMYWGAKMQKLVPSAWLKLMLAVIVVFVSARYLAGYLLS